MHFENPPYEQMMENFSVDFSMYVASKQKLFETSPFLMVRTNRRDLSSYQYKGILPIKLTKLSLSLENGRNGCYSMYQKTLENSENWNCDTFQPHEESMPDSKEYTTHQLEFYDEKQFWDEIYQNPKKVIVYGTDLDNSQSIPSGPIWDLNNLKTCLNEILLKNSQIEGITTTFAYFGFPQSYFPLHKEDADLGSVNYLLQGSPKIWYGFLKKDSERIIQYLRRNYSHDYKTCPEAHRHKTFFLDVAALQRFFPDLKVFRAVQTPGTYMFTAPGTFHQGFNTGYNLASAVNFGTTDWLAEFYKIKYCLCMSNIWNSKEILITKRLENEKKIVNRQNQCKMKKELEKEEINKYKLNEKNAIKDCNVTTKHFSQLRSGLFAVIVSKTQADFVFTALSNIVQNAKIQSYILVPEETLERETEALKWQVYRVIKKTANFPKSYQNNKRQHMHEIELLKKKMKLEFQSQEIHQKEDEEQKTPPTKFRTPRITAFRLFRSVHEYGQLLQHCLLMPIFSSSSPQKVFQENEKKGRVHNSFYNLRMKTINTLILEKICYLSHWANTNIKILSTISHTTVAFFEEDDNVSHGFENNTISILHSSLIDGNCHLVVIDEDGIVRLDSIFPSSIQSRITLWQDKVFPLLNSNSILCFNKSELLNFFALDDEDSLIPPIIESLSNMLPQEEMQYALMAKFHTKIEFQHLDLTSKTFSLNW